MLPVVALLAAAACGKRGDPLPPLPRTPQAVGGFAVAQRAGQLEVTMVAPRMTTGGETLGVVELELLRLDGPGELEKGRRQRFRAAPGERVVETFPLPPPGTPVKMAARAVHRGQVSVMGKMVVLTVQPPPPPPPSLTADLRPTGVLLTWTMPALPSPAPLPTPAANASASPGAPPPAGHASPSPHTSAPPSPAPEPGASLPPAVRASPAASAAPAGGAAGSPSPPPPPRVRLYRRAAEGEWALLVPDALAGTSFEDTAAAQGQTWCYAARLVTAPDPMVESADSPEACLEVKDVFPPAPPSGLTALLQGEEVEVSWSPSSEADLEAYRLYRASGDGGAPQLVAEVPAGTTTIRDAAAAGTLHVYRLSAVDRQGNESAHSAPAEVRRP